MITSSQLGVENQFLDFLIEIKYETSDMCPSEFICEVCYPVCQSILLYSIPRTTDTQRSLMRLTLA